MKQFRRYFSLFLCLVVSLGAFSPVVNAEEVELPAYHIYTTGTFVTAAGSQSQQAFGTFYPGTDESKRLEKSWDLAGADNTNDVKQLLFTFNIANTDGSALISKKGTYDFILERLFIYGQLKDYTSGASKVALNNPSSVTIRVQYTDNSVSYGTSSILKANTVNPLFDIQGSFTSTKAVKQIQIDVAFDVKNSYAMNGIKCVGVVEYVDSTYFKLTADEQDPNTGLISSLLSKVTSGFTNIGNWFTDLGNGIADGFNNLIDTVTGFFDDAKTFFTNIINAVVELPAKLWKLIEDGLKSLFIPSEAQLLQMYAEMEEKMADKLGVLWQAITIFDSVGDMMNTDVTGTITIPQVTIPVGGGERFSFGPYDVKVVPDAFMQYVYSCKTIVNVVITLLFINVIRKRLLDFLA